MHLGEESVSYHSSEVIHSLSCSKLITRFPQNIVSIGAFQQVEPGEATDSMLQGTLEMSKLVKGLDLLHIRKCLDWYGIRSVPLCYCLDFQNVAIVQLFYHTFWGLAVILI